MILTAVLRAGHMLYPRKIVNATMLVAFVYDSIGWDLEMNKEQIILVEQEL